jgi:hypothetical protein
MIKNVENMSIRDRFEHLFNVIKSERFLQMKGIGNEVPFFICPFVPSDMVEFQKLTVNLQKKLKQNGINIININLYDLVIKLIKDRGSWEKFINRESEFEKEKLKEMLQSMVDIQKYIAPEIEKLTNNPDIQVVFLTGVGEVFPYIRSHNLLNNLQKSIKTKPLILFFPGKYTHTLENGASLDLFGVFKNDKYYRAFNVYDFTCQ